MRVLVTGGAGFIGSHVAGLLLARGHAVTVLDDLSTGRRENLPVQAGFQRADLLDGGSLRSAVGEAQPQVVMHLAAQVNLRVSLREPARDARVNILGSLAVMQEAIRVGARRIVFASSGGAVYGPQDYFPADEEHPTRPTSPYGLAKLSVEGYLSMNRDLESVSLRLANIYGPRQDARGEAGVVAIFIQKVTDGETPVIFGDGKQTRDFVYVTDAAEAFALAMDGPQGVYNIGTGVETSVNDLLGMVRQACGREAAPRHDDAVAGEVRRSCLQAEKARQDLGWNPAVTLSEGVQRTVEHFKENPS